MKAIKEIKHLRPIQIHYFSHLRSQSSPMSHSSGVKQRVYLASRAVFAGQYAQIRKIKRVREILRQHKSAFNPLAKDFSGFNRVADVVKCLLDDGIFESELKAKTAFPELFQISQARDVQHTVSEVDTARSEAEALAEIDSENGVEIEPEIDTVPSEAGALEGTISEKGLESEPEDNHKDDDVAHGLESPPSAAALQILHTTKNPSLYPAYLPYRTQHLILTTTQRLLEECCFGFAVKWLPFILKKNNWDCAEAAELNKWAIILVRNLPAGAVDKAFGENFAKTVYATVKVRNIAVHRFPTSARGLHKLIESALRLTKALGDSSRAALLEDLCLEIERRIRDMELNKNFLEDRLDKQLQPIQEQRAALDREEKEAIATMRREDQENNALIGSFLEASIMSVFNLSEKEPIESSQEVNGTGEETGMGSNDKSASEPVDSDGKE